MFFSSFNDTDYIGGVDRKNHYETTEAQLNLIKYNRLLCDHIIPIKI